MQISTMNNAYAFKSNEPMVEEPKVEQKPQKVGLGKKLIVATATVPTTLKASEFGINKIMKNSKELATRIFNDFGKTLPSFKRSTIASVKWTGILAGTVIATMLALRDSDKNGQIDLLEGLGKIFGI